MEAYRFVAVYCKNFIIFFCVNLRLFSLTFVPLLAPNPGDVTGSIQERAAKMGAITGA